MIAPDGPLDASPILFKDVELAGGHGSVVSASLHASALGIFEARLNGVSVGPDLMSPGWSAYQWRLRYRSYDVTDRLDQSTRLTLSLGNGWFHGTLGWEGQRHSYGTRLGAIAQLEVTFEDGYQQLIATDRSWSACASDVLENDLYNGQTIDARLRRPEWATPGVCVPNQTGVEEIDFDTGRLAPVRRASDCASGDRAPTSTDTEAGRWSGHRRLRAELGRLDAIPGAWGARAGHHGAACRSARR
ncbi:hypothetical protein SGRIM119S_02516 [Streptomyces griseorubiginosus]